MEKFKRIFLVISEVVAYFLLGASLIYGPLWLSQWLEKNIILLFLCHPFLRIIYHLIAILIVDFIFHHSSVVSYLSLLAGYVLTPCLVFLITYSSWRDMEGTGGLIAIAIISATFIWEFTFMDYTNNVISRSWNGEKWKFPSNFSQNADSYQM